MTDKRLTALKETWSRLDEDKTPQEIGYHLTDYNGYRGVLKTNGLLANPKEKKFTGVDTDWNVHSLEGVYVTNNIPKAIRYYSAKHGSTYLFIIKYTLKSALSDPQYDLVGFTGKFYKESGMLDKIQALRTKSGGFVLDDIKNLVGEYNDAFIKELHEKLSGGNTKVPFKKELFTDFLYLSMCKDFRWWLEFKEAGGEFWKKVVAQWHAKADAISRGYSGFKRAVSDSVRLPYDVGFSGKNKIIGIIHTESSKEDFNKDMRHNDRYYGGGRDERPERKPEEVSWYVDYGNLDELKKLTGLKIYKNRNDEYEQLGNELRAKREKERAEIEARKRAARLAKAKQARLLKKQQKAAQAVVPQAPEQEPTNAG